MWFELSEEVGAAAWLRKGRTHKYVRRVPKPGGGYRYYYRTGKRPIAEQDRDAKGQKFDLTHLEQARATYSDPAYAALRGIEGIKGKSPTEAAKQVDYHRGIAQDLKGRFGLNGPAPAGVQAPFDGLAGVIGPVVKLDNQLRSEGLASDEKAPVMESAKTYADFRGMDFTDQARATYTDPGFAAMRMRDLITSGDPIHALERVNYHRGIAQDLRGRFGLNGPAPSQVQRVFESAAAALQPIKEANDRLRESGWASDQRDGMWRSPAGYEGVLAGEIAEARGA